MKNRDIVKNLLMKENNKVSVAMNKVQDIVEQMEQYDEEGVKEFFIKVNENIEETEGSDCLIVNDIVFDWKEFNKPEMLDELVTLALKSMKTEESRKKLRSLLLK